jgi:2-dehydropantoate 2-reductase
VRIVVVGAGAIGGYIGARLCRAGADVVLVARGAHLDAMRARGLRILSPDGDFDVTPQATNDLGPVGEADVVLLAVKAPGLTALAPALHPLIGPATTVVTMQNGLPWWYFLDDPGPLHGQRLERVDPGGVIGAAIDSSRVVGSLIYFSADVAEPGVIRHTEGRRLSLGEPDGSRSDRVRAVAEALIAAGFRCPVTTRLRHEIWVKLLGNVAFNPLSALTGRSLEALARDPDTSRVAREVMTETERVATALGLDLPISIDQRIAGAAQAGGHKTSMLQDREAGRPMEIDAVVGGVLEVAGRLGIAMPATQALYDGVRQLVEDRAPGAGGPWRATPA